jgi:hypothetical protein
MGGDLNDPHTLFFHVRIFLGMVVSFGLAHWVRGLARIIERPRYKRVYWIHLVWVASMLVLLLHFWWWELRFAQHVDWTFHIYLFLVFYALVLCLLSALLFPDHLDEYADYREYFYARRRWFFAILALAYVLDFADTALKGSVFFQSLGPEYVARNIGYIAASVIAMFVRSPVYHGAFVVIASLHQITWIARMYERLNG